MPFDLNILVLEQEKQSSIDFSSSIVVLNEIDNKDHIGRYHSIWPFMTNTKGIWYQMVTPDPEFDDLYIGSEICYSDYDLPQEKLHIPFWISNDEVVDCLTPIFVNKNYDSDFKKIME